MKDKSTISEKYIVEYRLVRGKRAKPWTYRVERNKLSQALNSIIELKRETRKLWKKDDEKLSTAYHSDISSPTREEYRIVCNKSFVVHADRLDRTTGNKMVKSDPTPKPPRKRRTKLQIFEPASIAG